MTELPNCFRCGSTPCRCADGVTVLQGDCKTVMESLPEKHFQMCVTSPPYFLLRSYLPDDHPDKALEIGSEPTIEEFVATMVEVFRGVWRVLRDDGVCFVNLGDSYASGGRGGGMEGERGAKQRSNQGSLLGPKTPPPGLKPKDLCGIPWRVALALQAEGWYLRDAICWQKPAPMPGSQRDRCTSSYEFLFQLTKKPRYFWDMESVKEKQAGPLADARLFGKAKQTGTLRKDIGNTFEDNGTRIPRNAQRFEWVEEDVRALLEYMNATPACPNILKIASEGYPGAHFATMPRALPEWCIKAATSERGCCPECGTPWVRVVEREANGGWSAKYAAEQNEWQPRGGGIRGKRADGVDNPAKVTTIGWEPGCKCTDIAVCRNPANANPFYPLPCRVLDPFGGAGTSGLAAIGLQRHCTLIELASDYCDQIVKRLRDGLYAKTQKRDDLPGQLQLFQETSHGVES